MRFASRIVARLYSLLPSSAMNLADECGIIIEGDKPLSKDALNGTSTSLSGEYGVP